MRLIHFQVVFPFSRGYYMDPSPRLKSRVFGISKTQLTAKCQSPLSLEHAI
jgi:hypothetical protein